MIFCAPETEIMAVPQGLMVKQVQAPSKCGVSAGHMTATSQYLKVQAPSKCGVSAGVGAPAGDQTRCSSGRCGGGAVEGGEGSARG